jgi:hypothetical protein
MNTLSFNQKMNQSNLRDRDVLSAFRKTPERRSEIERGMSPQEIAEIVSDRLMAIVKDQFEAAKKQFDEKQEQY